ncbi:MAG: TRAP transporter small permease [Lachnospiraceae bacterium]|nr:TRAP transporter small permease [Lachnospiraceae bacterium]
MKYVMKILDIFEKGMCILLGAMMVVLLGTITLQVIARYCFSTPPTWTEELARRLMQLIIFCGAGIGYRKAEMNGITLLVERMTEKSQKLVAVLMHVVVIAFCVYLTYYGCLMCRQVGNQLSPALGMPKWPFMASIPFFGITTGIFALEKIYKVIKTGVIE